MVQLLRMIAKLGLFWCAIALTCQAQPANRRTVNINPNDTPKLENSLAVALSPLEPVTVPKPLAAGSPSDTLNPEASSEARDRRTTRSTQLLEQENDNSSSSSSASSSEATSDDASSTKSLAGSTPITTTESGETATATDLPESTESTTSKDTEQPETTTTTTTPAPVSVSDTTTEAAPTSTQPPIESSSTTGSSTGIEFVSGSEDKSSAATTTPAPAVVETTPTTTAPKSVEPETELPSTPEPASSSDEKEAALTTTTVAPSTQSPTTSELPSTSSTAQPTSEQADDKKVKESCNHLPTYESDELQKVFREETTYRNGTIKGKFTYVNFDQRYRLVHYTRLPYGPVKIDLVEELGKPDQNGSNGTMTDLNEVPNAVLQLRNVLPNSLFGFPFLAPSSANSPSSGRAGGQPLSSPNGNDRRVSSEPERPNRYFYSTESISNGAGAGQAQPQQQLGSAVNPPASNADTLSASYFENLPVGNAVKPPAGVKSSSQASNLDPGQPRQSPVNPPLHIQYATAAQQGGLSSPQLPALYPYGVQPQPLHHQYAPLPLYSFQQPFQAARQPPIAYSGKLRVEPASESLPVASSSSSSPSGIIHQTHQPHSHEHYVAPFMFLQPPSPLATPDTTADQEAAKLKLRIKSSRNLSVHREQYGKSAPLRQAASIASTSSSSSSAHSHHHHDSPAIALRARQRSGKQNQDLKSNVNPTPVVYHVLRNPMNQVYALPHYNQPHAIAYDHDEMN